MKKALLLLWFLVFGTLGFGQEYNARYELKNLGREVNTAYHDGAPVISADGKTLFFFVHNHPENNNGTKGSQDIWYAQREADGTWGEAKHMKRPLNEHNSNQVFSVLPDGTLFIRGGSSKNSKGFSFTGKVNGEWSNPEEIRVDDFKAMNQGKFYGATISSDRKFMILYFSEKENGTFSDLYMSKNLGDGNWSRPQKLADNINTGRDEFAPFLAPNDEVLYFSSNRKDMGLGNADIYKTKRLDDTWLKWSDPVNVGRPLNTRAFDAYMSIDHSGQVFTAQSGDTRDGGNLDIFSLHERDIRILLRGVVMDVKTRSGVLASLAIGNQGVDTLIESSGEGAYQIQLSGEGTYDIRVAANGYHPDEIRLSLKDIFNDTTIIQDFLLQPVKRNVLFTGTVYNAKTSEAISARVEVHLKSNPGVGFKKNSTTGYFENELEKKGWYMITATAEGFLNGTDSVLYTSDEKTLLNKDIYLNPIEVGATVRLNNIFFDFDKTSLKSESYAELDKVVEFLNNNSSLEIEIAGHTDSKGSDDYNLSLSQGRAQAVVDYLINSGVDDFRLIARGYGETVPLKTNETDDGRAFNRRVEFTVLKK